MVTTAGLLHCEHINDGMAELVDLFAIYKGSKVRVARNGSWLDCSCRELAAVYAELIRALNRGGMLQNVGLLLRKDLLVLCRSVGKGAW